jgi:Xaa-Pro aminopeptidase
LSEFEQKLKDAVGSKRKIHYLPQYQAENILEMERMLGMSTNDVRKGFSVELIKAVVKLRSIKSKAEIEEIEKALEISWKMYDTVYKSIKPGMHEYKIWSKLESVPLSFNTHISFPTILSVHGETLHNHYHNNIMKDGDLVIIDSGAESMEHYASDITRTFPVNGKFSAVQRDIYQIVLDALETATRFIRPQVKYKDIHLKAAEIIASGLKDVGLLKGDLDDIVENGAHALFFPHGLGHMLGLDVHDMEGLGENYVGYNDQIKRSSQFGLAYLRLGRELECGNVLTVEPGIYFIPQLINKWKTESINSSFINFSEIEKFIDFGGIRIEDDVVVTEKSYKVLGKPIPKKIDDLEDVIG